MQSFRREGIYLIFDPLAWKRSPWQEQIVPVLSYLCCIQLRSPGIGDNAYQSAAFELNKIVENSGVGLVINNRVDVAIETDSWGLHLGKSDMSVKEAASVFKGIIGASRHTPEGAKEAETGGADYIGCGPVFMTSTKDTGRDPVSVQGYLSVKQSVGIPVIPVGGIGPGNIELLRGHTRIAAVSSSINLSEDPLKTTKQMFEILLGSPMK